MNDWSDDPVAVETRITVHEAVCAERYASILGPYDPNIVRADLGDRGIYYRVRVGPFSGADATRLCEDLKAAGGDCIIAR